MTDWKNLNQKANKVSLESERGYLLCVDGEGKGYKKGRVCANRSRPGPWEIIEMIANPSQRSKQDATHIEKGTEVALRTFHGTYLQVAKANNKEGIPAGVVCSGKNGEWFTICVLGDGRTAFKNSAGHYLRVNSSGTVFCSSPDPSSECLFRFFPRKQEYDDPRHYYDVDGKGKQAITEFENAVTELCGRFLLSLPVEQLQAIERLFIQIEQMWWFYEDHYADHNKTLPHITQEEFGRQVFRLCSLLQGSYKNYGELYKKYQMYMSKVPVYGAILLNQNMDKCLMVRSYRGKTWMFPRGKVNEGESDALAAIREVEEEVGYNCAKLLNPKNFIAYKESKTKDVKLFIVEGVEENVKFLTQTRKEIGKIAWQPLKDLPNDKDSAGSNKFKGVLKAIRSLKIWVSNKKSQKKGGKNSVALKSDPSDLGAAPKGNRSKKKDKTPLKQQDSQESRTAGAKGKRATASDGSFQFNKVKIMEAFDKAFV
jgi:mRNA-decapping enzyme subunit 2